MTSAFLAGVLQWSQGAAPFIGSPAPVAGPFYQQAAITPLAFPYCVFFSVGAPIPDFFSNSTGSVENIRLQFSLWGTNNAALFDYANQISARFKAALIPLSSGVVLGCLPSALPYGLPVSPTTKSPPGSPIYHVALDLRFRIA